MHLSSCAACKQGVGRTRTSFHRHSEKQVDFFGGGFSGVNFSHVLRCPHLRSVGIATAGCQTLLVGGNKGKELGGGRGAFHLFLTLFLMSCIIKM